MLLYSSPVYRGDVQHTGYEFSERSAICGECGEIIDQQIQYSGIDEEFRFSDPSKSAWTFCPYCSAPLYERSK